MIDKYHTHTKVLEGRRGGRGATCEGGGREGEGGRVYYGGRYLGQEGCRIKTSPPSCIQTKERERGWENRGESVKKGKGTKAERTRKRR